jgi:diacylglycerol kinase family enzyme
MEKLHFFAETLAEICTHSLIAPNRPLRWVVIANPTAGSFVIPSRWIKCHHVLEESLRTAQANPRRENAAPAQCATADHKWADGQIRGLLPTKGSNCAEEIAHMLIAEIAAAVENPGADGVPFYLLITAGGDGTSLGALSAVYHASAAVRANMAVLRLPLGTGNDGADSPHLDHALDLLIKPSRIKLNPAVQLTTATGKGPFPAFNILSVGLDAFVTHMTNKMKGKLPGDFYKLWVDIASLLYDRLYTVGNLDVRATDEHGGEVRSFREKILLLAVGASGHRTYGSQKKILPDDRNICAMRQMPLLRKVALKELFDTGTHIDKPESIAFNAHRVAISGKYPILAQMDGETILLQKEDFPVIIELTEPLIPVLKKE